MPTFRSEDIISSKPPEPYHENDNHKIKAIVKETILELLEDQEFIEYLKTKLKLNS
jgi:hypothetical protein